MRLRRFGIVPVVSAPIHGINKWPKSREMPSMRECRDRHRADGPLALGQLTSADAALHHNFKWGARLSADMLTSARRIRRRC